jgi:VWFA-related protein
VSLPRAGFAFLLFLAVAARAQAPPQDSSFSATVDVRLAEVEVLVTDRDGRPVTGLTREDFRVLEDGLPAEVTNLSPVSGQPVALAVFLDDTNLAGPVRAATLDGLARFFAGNLKPGDRVLLVRWDGALEVREPSGDVAALGGTLRQIASEIPHNVLAQERAAILREILQARPLDDERGSGLAISQASAVVAELRAYAETGAANTRATLAALQQTLTLLGTLPERKALLYVGGGLPQRPGADLFDAWNARFGQLRQSLGVSPFEASRGDASRQVQETADQANAAGIAIHALAATERGPIGTTGGPLSPGIDPEDAGRSLRTLTASTGGMIFAGTVNPAPFLETVRREIGTGYVVGYAPPPGRTRGKHRVEVIVRGGALTARFREARFDGDPGDPLLRRALAGLWADGAANPLQAELSVEEAVPEEDGRFKVTAVVALPLTAVTVQPREHFHVGHLTVAVAARDAKGRLSGLPHDDFPVEIPNERLLSAPGQSAGYRFTVHLAPGESVLAVALRDDFSGAEGIARLQIDPGKK